MGAHFSISRLYGQLKYSTYDMHAVSTSTLHSTYVLVFPDHGHQFWSWIFVKLKDS